MKLDENLFRELLLIIEQKEDIHSRISIKLPLDKVILQEDSTYLSPEEKKKRQEEICWFHMRLLLEAGYIKGTLSKDHTGKVFVEHLTWQGHELLDMIRDDTLWKKIRSLCTQKIMPAMLSEIASKSAEQLVCHIKTILKDNFNNYS